MKTYSGYITKLDKNQIFVFGSNPEGRHGGGGAKVAHEKFGAEYGNGRGIQGQSYALVTKSLKTGFIEESTGIIYLKKGFRSVSMRDITRNIAELYEYAKINPNKEFLVAYGLGKNLNGYTSEEMADMFFHAGEIPKNMVFEENFKKLIDKNMSLKDKLRSALLKEAEDKFKYGCVMIELNVDPDWWKEIQDDISDKDLKEATEERSYGRVNDPHVTVLFGLHEEVEDSEIESRIESMDLPEVKLKEISFFDKSPEFDVVKFDIESEDLHNMNKMFTELPHTTDYPDYHPHATIAYVKKGTGEKYKRTLSDDESRVIKPSKVIYSKPDGSKKEYTIK